MISSQELTAEQRLPSESELCERLGVSRGSLREAVRMLAALGVVESRHGSGVYVSSLKPEEFMRSLALTVELLPLSGVLELYEVRRVLESYAAGQAAAKATPLVHAQLRDMLIRLDDASSPNEASVLDAEFHQLVAEAGGNATITALLAVMKNRSRAYQIYGSQGTDAIRRMSEDGHRQIAEAIIAGDPAMASAAMASHVAQTEIWLRHYAPAPDRKPLDQQLPLDSGPAQPQSGELEGS